MLAYSDKHSDTANMLAIVRYLPLVDNEPLYGLTVLYP